MCRTERIADEPMEPKKISKMLLKRLPLYLSYLKTLPEQIRHISATKIAEALDLGDVLVRKDLAKVSDGGRKKLGYLRDELIRDIEEFLDVNRTVSAVVVGAGKLGQALLDYEGFRRSGLEILAGFDAAPSVRKTVADKPICAMDALEGFCRDHEIAIGIITVPADQAQTVCDRLVGCGIGAIWNFSPAHLNVPEQIVLQNENLAVSVTALKMQLKTR